VCGKFTCAHVRGPYHGIFRLECSDHFFFFFFFFLFSFFRAGYLHFVLYYFMQGKKAGIGHGRSKGRGRFAGGTSRVVVVWTWTRCCFLFFFFLFPPFVMYGA